MNTPQTIAETLHTPVKERVDVLVCGGGPAGCGAALAAARLNARVRLVESYGFLGGVVSAAGICGLGAFQHDVDGTPLFSGITEEIYREAHLRSDGDAARLQAIFSCRQGRPDYRAAGFGHWLKIYPEIFKRVLDEALERAGVRTLLLADAVRPIREGTRVTGVAVESKSGREAILADVVIDATGDGDLAARAGAPFALGRPGDGACQPMSQIFVIDNCDPPELYYGMKDDPNPDPLSRNRYRGAIALARERGEIALNPNDLLCACDRLFKETRLASVNFTRIQRHSAIDAEALSRAFKQGRRQVDEAVAFMRAYVKGSAGATLAFTYPHIGIRESRRILGDYTLTGDDVRNGARFDDAIARGFYLMDIHNPTETGKPSDLIVLDQPYDIPYRCLLPRGVEGLLTAGRCISGDHRAMSSYRITSHCMAVGVAAGAAAALAADRRVPPRQLTPDDLRAALRRANTRMT